ncbi:EndoU domain-containing protein [Zhihengliuella halotolerans]|uniref:EndoU domain-containing protein n=1 Tax=Zhihengliuella halotolerans TaxID=370736 RepID=UPI000C804535|nr:EndoU domain-containing protein [Zhihengliuella halotolerans]
MCRICDLAAAEILLAEETSALIAEQFAAGAAPPNAVRPLFVHEERAQVRFAELDEALERSTAVVAAIVTTLHEELREIVLAALFPAGAAERSPEEVLAAFAALHARQPTEVRVALDQAMDRLDRAYADTYRAASGAAIAEARRQGARAPVTAPTPEPDRMRPAAQAVVLRTWQWLMFKAHETVGLPSSLPTAMVPRESVERILGRIEPKGAIDQARQGVHVANGGGRIETAEVLEPVQIYASEIMDGNTCRACSEIDGIEYADMEEAREDYPLGFYRGCDGDARCRGTLVFIYGDPDDEIPADPDEDLPEPQGLVTEDMLRHIVRGDGPTQGGHTFGFFGEGKTVFPEDWDDARVGDAVSKVMAGTPRQFGRGRLVWEAEQDGVMIRAAARRFESQATDVVEIVPKTAFPLYGQGVFVTRGDQRIPLPTREARDREAQSNRAGGSVES